MLFKTFISNDPSSLAMLMSVGVLCVGTTTAKRSGSKAGLKVGSTEKAPSEQPSLDTQLAMLHKSSKASHGSAIATYVLLTHLHSDGILALPPLCFRAV